LGKKKRFKNIDKDYKSEELRYFFGSIFDMQKNESKVVKQVKYIISYKKILNKIKKGIIAKS